MSKKTKALAGQRLWPVVLIAVLLLVSVVAGCVTSPPPTNEAESNLCEDLANFEDALAPLTNISLGTTVEDLQAFRDEVGNAWAEVEESAQDYYDARVRDLQDAYDELDKAVNDLPGDVTVSEAADLLEGELRAVREARRALSAGPDCG